MFILRIIYDAYMKRYGNYILVNIVCIIKCIFSWELNRLNRILIQ